MSVMSSKIAIKDSISYQMTEQDYFYNVAEDACFDKTVL